MTSTITKTTIESNSYENVVAFLNDRTIITDPRDPSGVRKRTFVYDVDPLAKSVNFSDFPYIVAEYPVIEYSNVSTDGKIKDVSWSMKLIVRTARKGANQGTNSTGKKDMSVIGDDLQTLFNSVSHRQSFQDLNMFFMKLTKNGFNGLTIDEKYVYETTYNLAFTTRMVVSD